jgi:heptosyltransferase-2
VAPLGCVDDARGLELAAAPEDIEAVRAFLGAKRPSVGIAAGAAFGPSKMWPAERYAATADRLTETLGAGCVLITGPGEESVRDRVMSAVKYPMKCLDAQFRGIRYLKAAVSQLDLLIGNDSGVRHVAVAFHVPTVCIIGPTRPAYSCGPYEKGRVVRVDVDCGPCQKPDCETDHCCMTQISVEMIVESAMDILKGNFGF